MLSTLAGTALLMGLAGGPHCVAMCGAACSGVIQLARAPRGGVAVLPASELGPSLTLHAGRIAAYAAAGAVAAMAVQSLGWASERAVALRPLWVLLHAFILGWALVLLATGRQPLWIGRVGRSLSARLRPWVATPWGLLASGALWVLLPCGLLYSALMLAGLASGPLEGAVVMALFALGGAVWMLAAPWVWTQLRERGDALRKDWGTRVAGLLLAAVAVQALWIDMRHQIELWCS
jgi:sulfite exporter TauE/SafE